jgi:hypothetical protein
MALSGDDHDWPEVGERLRKIRHLAGYTEYGDQKQFALDYDFHPCSWNHWEKGGSIPWQEALKVTKVLSGVTLDWIYLGVRDGLTVRLDHEIANLDLPPRRPRRRNRSA